MPIIYCSYSPKIIPVWFHGLEKSDLKVSLFPQQSGAVDETLFHKLMEKTVHSSLGTLLKNENFAKPFAEVKQIFESNQTSYTDNYEFKSFYVLARSDLVIADFNYPYGFEDSGCELFVAWLLGKRIIGVSNSIYLSPFLVNRCDMIVKSDSNIIYEEVQRLSQPGPEKTMKEK